MRIEPQRTYGIDHHHVELWIVTPPMSRHGVGVHIARMVDYFDTYLGDFILVAFRRQRALLSGTIEIRRLVEAGSLEEVIGEITTQRTNSVSYRSFRQVMKFFRDDLRVRPEIANQDLKRVTDLFAVRNLLVHHDGLVTQWFAPEVKRPRLRVGSRVELNEFELANHEASLIAAVHAIDHAVVGKLGAV